MITIDLGNAKIVFKNRRKYQSSSVDFLEQSKMLYNMDRKLERMKKISK